MAELDEKELNPLKAQKKAAKIKPQEQESKEPKETAVSEAPASPTDVIAEHTVVAGENLSQISEQYYETPNLYMKIYEANKDLIGDNPSLIRVGQVLKIPK